MLFEGENADDLLMDAEDGFKDQMDGARTVSVERLWFCELPSFGLWPTGVAKGWKGPPQAWWVPKPLDNGQFSS